MKVVGDNCQRDAAVKEDLSDWHPRARPEVSFVEGRYINIAPYNPRHHPLELWDSFGGVETNKLLYHFGWPQLSNASDLGSLLTGFNESGEFVTAVFVDKNSGNAVGMASYMRIDCDNGVVETGSIAHGSALARTPAATEAHFLMARHIFDDLGYRRYEWKLNNANKPSHDAAKRLGFTFEGVFRQHQVKPYGNRDTAWYSMLDKEWPRCKAAFEAWLDPGNFDAKGGQKSGLQKVRENT